MKGPGGPKPRINVHNCQLNDHPKLPRLCLFLMTHDPGHFTTSTAKKEISRIWHSFWYCAPHYINCTYQHWLRDQDILGPAQKGDRTGHQKDC